MVSQIAVQLHGYASMCNVETAAVPELTCRYSLVSQALDPVALVPARCGGATRMPCDCTSLCTCLARVNRNALTS